MVQAYGLPVTLLVIGIFFVLVRLDVVKRLFVGRQQAENDEREQLSEDTQRLIDNLRGDADRQRQWRIDEGQRYETQLATMRARYDAVVDSLTSSERGNSRLRHELRDVLTWAAEVRHRARLLGSPLPEFPLKNLTQIDEALALKMKEIFAESDERVAHLLESRVSKVADDD